jgi:uncharacterized protein YceK
MKQLLTITLLLLVAGCGTVEQKTAQPRGLWTVEQANTWYGKQPWLVGCNFTPSSAINQLELWQAESWDPVTIDRELGWAQELGFTSVRVFLHDIAWRQDHEGFLKRVDQFLGIAAQHRIGVMLVVFDGVWDPFPKPGRQREPYPHRHNSGWVQSPAQEILKDPARHDELKAYVQDLIGRFRADRRVQVWDLYNEPDNPVPQYKDVELKNKAEMALRLLQKTFVWAREVNPTQPLTSGVWIGNWPDPAKLTPMEHCQLEQSDVISFHCYGKVEEMQKCIQNLHRYQRPILCTEYMVRPAGSRFDPVLGCLKENHVAAYNWGFVDGKTQTIYPWDSWTKQYTSEPTPWFHDILRRDGTPYDAAEVDYIKRLTHAAQGR